MQAPIKSGAPSTLGTSASAVRAADAAGPGLPGILSDAGRIVAQYETARFDPIAAALTAAPQANAPARPTPSRARAANQQAVQGVRFAQEGKHAAAIQRFTHALALDPTAATVHHDLGLAYLTTGRLEEAVGAFGTALRLQPTLRGAYLNLATALDRLERGEEAERAYETAVRLEPEHHEAHARLGQFHQKNARPEQAVAAYRAAAGAARETGLISARLYDGLAAQAGGKMVEAEAMLRALIDDHPGYGHAHGVLAQILAESGRSEMAAASFERCISLDPTMVSTWYHFAINKKFGASDDALIERMQTALIRPDLTSSQRQQINFAVGKAYNDRGEYAAAIRYIEAANAIRGAGRRLDRVTLARQTDHAIASTPPGFLARRPDFGVEDDTPIFIVGMPRSGTTLVEQILSSHPDVAPGGELGFWRKHNQAGHGIFDAAAHPEAVRRVARDYLAVLRSIAPDTPHVTDKMPFNFAHLGVIRQTFPRAAIVHCRRHPIDTCWSIFSTDFEAAFDFAGDRGSLAFFYRQYLRLMAHWRDVLPADRFIEVDYETLVADPEPLTRRLVATCGLQWNDACLAPHKNQRQILTSSLWQARQPIYRTSVERWRHYEPWLGELRDLSTDTVPGAVAGGNV